MIHELGHFLVAKKLGFKVLAFSIGFGKALISKKIGDTDYRICAIPVGGYVHMAGEHPDDKQSGDPQDFYKKPIWQRACVAIAGPAANFIFSVLLLYIAFLAGIKQPAYLNGTVVGAVENSSVATQAGILAGDTIISINGHSVKTWEAVEQAFMRETARTVITLQRSNSTTVSCTLTLEPVRGSGLPKQMTGGLMPALPAIIGAVTIGSPADKAGIRSGDQIISIDSLPIHSWYEVSNAIIKFDSLRTIQQFSVKRGDNQIMIACTPVFDKEVKRFRIGIAVAEAPGSTVRYSPSDAIGRALAKSWEYTRLIYDVIAKLVSSQVSPRQLAGPIGIVQMSGIIAFSGLVPMLTFMALIGINLAVLNLMPLIITDGGLLLFLLYEAIRGKPLSLKHQLLINRGAIAFFLLLFLYVTFNDITRIPELLRFIK